MLAVSEDDEVSGVVLFGRGSAVLVAFFVMQSLKSRASDASGFDGEMRTT